MKKITFLLVCFSVYASAQIEIKGIVAYDSIPMESASVIIKNTTKGVATNEKGQFRLEAKKGDTLSISYLGYKTTNIVVNKEEKLNINLEIDSTLDEITVLAYGLSETSTCTIACMSICQLFEDEVVEEKMISKERDIPFLFPNPSSSGIFQLKLNENYKEVKISIANLNGQTIQSSAHQKFGDKLNIDLSEFATGIYIINIVADGKPLKSIKAVRG